MKITHDCFFHRERSNGFTLIELLTVMAVIAILAGLVLSSAGYIQSKGARSRAEAEIAGMSTACESYKADNGAYPQTSVTDSLDAKLQGNPTSSSYSNASTVLYRALSGDTDLNRGVDASDSNKDIAGNAVASPSNVPPKSYFRFKPAMLLPSTAGATTVTAIADPFGYSYGYSTANTANSNKGYNPTFDLWSTSGSTANPTGATPDTVTAKWIKNW